MSGDDVDVEVEAYVEPYVEGEDDDVETGGYKVEDIDEGVGADGGGGTTDGDPGFADDADINDELAGVGDARKMLNPLDSMDGYTVLVTLLVVNIVEFVAAIVFTANLVAGNLNPDFGLGVWAVVGGLLSIVTVVVMLILKKCNEVASVKVAPWLSLWLLVLWIAIVFPCTFQPPFAAFGNGYVGAWGSLVVAGTLATRSFADKAASIRKAIQSQTQSDTGKWTMVCGLASIVVMIAGSFKASTATDGYVGYSISVGVISVIACALILTFVNVASMKRHSGLVNTILSIFLAVWWVIGAFILTFVNPFNLSAGQTVDADGNIVSACTGFNGYFATFAATFAALKLFQACGLDFVKSKMASLRKGGGGVGGGGTNVSTEPADPAL